MYRKHFGLLRNPFEFAPDPDTLFLSGVHREVLAGLQRGLAEESSFLLLTGGAGAGKTTLLNALVASLDTSDYLCRINNPRLEIADFFQYLGGRLGLLFQGNKAKFLVLFAGMLEACRCGGQKILLIIDEAHLLSVDVLEELRLLMHLAAEVNSGFSILLAGEPELLGRLTREQLFCLYRRDGVRYHLGNLTEDECRQYILFRLERAGVPGIGLFSDEAWELIYLATGGNPRRVNLLCDNALLAAFARGATAVDEALVRECVERLHIHGRGSPQEIAGMRKWLSWTVLAMLLAECAGAAYAYQQGWLVPVCQYLMRSIKLG